MIKFLTIFLFIFLTNCSLDKASGFWSKSKKIEKIEKNKKTELKEVFKKPNNLRKELNVSLKINLSSRLIKNSFVNNLDNNNGRIDYEGNLKSISRFKFSKIDNFNNFEPEIVFDKNNLIFFDNKGSILKFNEKSKLIWKFNNYNKSEKKTKPILFMATNKKTLVVADNISKYYAVNVETGKILWTKNNTAPFNSQVKIYRNKFFVIDFDDVLRCFSLKDGNELWRVKTETSFIKSQKKLSIIIINKKLYFNNSIGDISAVDIDSGNLLWQTPTQSNSIIQDSFSIKTSDLIANNNSIFFSNNKNEFYSLDIKTGLLNWKQEVNSNLRSTLIDDLIFSISNEGFLIVLNSTNGNIIRITDIMKVLNIDYLIKKFRKRTKVLPVGFIVGSKNIYLTTSNGKLIIVDILSGQPLNALKIDNEKISRPFVLNKDLFIVKDNSIIKLN